MTRVVVLLLALTVLAGCGGTDGPPFRTSSPGPEPITAIPDPTPAGADAPRVIDTIASKLAVPWGIAFLPDGSALVTERDTGRVLRVNGHQVSQVGSINEVHSEGGEAGLLGIAVSPTYSTDHRVFIYASTDGDNRVLRMRYVDGRLTPPEPILTGIPQGFVHDGGRLQFGPDGNLYVSTGETGQRQLAQDPKSLGGKILRVTQDGRPAPGNPSAGSPVWTLGHRNVQGLAFDPTGHLWASEFGDQTWDELNLVQEGTNYGWPLVEGGSTLAGYRNPQVVWRTDVASPSGLAYADGYLWLGSLRGARLWRVSVDGVHASDPQDFFVGKFGRLRTVVRAPDGNLWVTTSNRDGRGDPRPGDDRILLVKP
jgi:glucose/arabinose dehydrogenase